MRYAEAIDGRDWQAHLYPVNSVCVLLIDNQGTITTSPETAEFYENYGEMPGANYAIARVYEPGEEGYKPHSFTTVYVPTTEYGTLYDTIDDLLNQIDPGKSLEQRVNEQLWEQEVISTEIADQRRHHWQMNILAGVVVILLAGIILAILWVNGVIP